MLNPKIRTNTESANRISNFLICIFCLLFHIFCLPLAHALNLDSAKVNFLKGDYPETIKECENILANAGSSSGLDELYHILGISYLKQGNLLRASDIFEIIIKEFKDSSFQESAVLGMGDVYMLKADYENAQNIYKQFLEQNPNSAFKSLIFYRLAQISLKNGNWQEYQGYSEKLEKDYPLSFE